MYVGMDNDIVRSTRSAPLQDRSGLQDTVRFGSAHPAILNVGLGDGSVRPVNYSVNLTVWRAFGDINSSVVGSLDN